MLRDRYAPMNRFALVPASPVSLPALTRMEAHAAETDVLGLSTGEHLMSFYRHWLEEQGILGSVDQETCDDGQRVQVGCVWSIKRHPRRVGTTS